MAKMKTKDARIVATLLEALDVLPKVKCSLTDKPVRMYDGVWLEMVATEMSGGEGQGGSHYFYLPAEVGQAVLDAARDVIRKKLAVLGVEVSSR